MLLDGVFAASQIESNTTDLKAAFGMISLSLRALADQLVQQSARHPR
jgi:hypothetical protein